MSSVQNTSQAPSNHWVASYENEILLAVVTLAALAALAIVVIGILAIDVNRELFPGLGLLAQLGTEGGGALTGLGTFVLLLIGGYSVYRCSSAHKGKEKETPKLWNPVIQTSSPLPDSVNIPPPSEQMPVS